MKARIDRNPENSPAVAVKELDVRFGDFFAVRTLSFTVQRGEIFGFLGANGAGKTSTIRVLCGLLPPSSGQVQVDGVSYADGEQAIKAKVGYMSQRFTLYDDLSVGENMAFAAALRRIAPKTFQERRQRLLNFVGFDRSLNSLVRSLPGGLKQQVSLATSLLHDPSIIFLDEPTAGVTPASRARFWALIHELQKEQKTIFVTTHYMDEAENCDRIALMRSGELIALDTVDGLKQSAFPEPIYEMTPLQKPLSKEEFGAFRRHPSMHSFQPYGIRYHAAIKSRESFESSRAQFEARFAVKEIKPSLEDVFIEMVEGGSR